MQHLSSYVSDHPVASTLTAASIITAALLLIYSHRNRSQKKIEEVIKLINQGPEFQVVRAIELMGDYFKLNCVKTMTRSTGRSIEGISRFFFRRDEVGEFFNKNEKLLLDFFPVSETLSAIHTVLADAANEAQLIEKRRKEAFDDNNPEHVAMLKKLWEIGIASICSSDDCDGNDGNSVTSSSSSASSIPFERFSSLWDRLGFQGTDPATDLRAGGVLALDIFVHFVQSHTDLVKMMHKHNTQQHKEGSLNWMLIACASIHVTVTLFKQIGDGNSSGSAFTVWTRPLLMAIYRGSAVMKFHPKAKIADRDRPGFMPTPKDYKSGLVRVVAVSEEMLVEESLERMSEDFGIAAAIANSPERTRNVGDNGGGDATSSIGDSSISSSSDSSADAKTTTTTTTYPRIRTGRMHRWSLFSSICRVHHHLMKSLFDEWIEKKPSVMEFESFIVKHVYEPFVQLENPVLL